MYIVLLLVFIATFVSVGISYRLVNKVQQQTLTIENNQKVNSNKIKEYIACLIAIDPKGNIKAQEKACFDNPSMVAK
jgi:hypothetical protein